MSHGLEYCNTVPAGASGKCGPAYYLPEVTCSCHAVWSQVGTDLEALERGLQHIASLRAKIEREPGSRGGISAAPPSPRPALLVLGSVLVPSKKLLAQMRFRPWGGVFLSSE